MTPSVRATALRLIVGAILLVEVSLVAAAASIAPRTSLILLMLPLLIGASILLHDPPPYRWLIVVEKACLLVVGFGHVMVPVLSQEKDLGQLFPVLIGIAVIAAGAVAPQPPGS